MVDSEMQTIFANCASLRLDFDDAYQYTVAGKFDLIIVSFDHDFDRTPRGRKTPEQVTA